MVYLVARLSLLCLQLTLGYSQLFLCFDVLVIVFDLHFTHLLLYASDLVLIRHIVKSVSQLLLHLLHLRLGFCKLLLQLLTIGLFQVLVLILKFQKVLLQLQEFDFEVALLIKGRLESCLHSFEGGAGSFFSAFEFFD